MEYCGQPIRRGLSAAEGALRMDLLDVSGSALQGDEGHDDLALIGGSRIERIVSRGHRSPPGFWYDQDHDEWCMVLQGEGVLGFADGTEKRLGPGHAFMLPAHVKHRVVSSSTEPPCIWIAVHGPVVRH